MRLLVSGLINSKTSLGEAVRRNIKCFETFTSYDIYDFNEFITNRELYHEYYKSNASGKYDVKYFHLTFDIWNKIKKETAHVKRLPNKKIGYFVWESTELSKMQQDCLYDFDEIWTASNYCRDIFSQYYNAENIHVIPHPIEIFDTDKKFDTFTILCSGNISSHIERKNILNNLKTALRFAEGKKVNIIFKTLTASNEERRLISQLDSSKITIIDRYMTSEEMFRLISKCHVFLSLHRSEGFGMVLAEAMACKTHVVATGYSGNVDFMQTNHKYLVDYKLVYIDDKRFKGQWAEPDYDHAISLLEYLYNNDDTETLLQNNEYIINNNSIITIAEKMKERIYRRDN